MNRTVNLIFSIPCLELKTELLKFFLETSYKPIVINLSNWAVLFPESKKISITINAALSSLKCIITDITGNTAKELLNTSIEGMSVPPLLLKFKRLKIGINRYNLREILDETNYF